MNKILPPPRRNSHMEMEEIYFWTATIHQWNKLLLDDSYKEIVLNSLCYLSAKKLVDTFAFVVMPNHLHFIWRLNKLNGKQSPHHSFLKHTAQAFKHKLTCENPARLLPFMVNTANKKYQFWKRDSLAIRLYNRQIAYQKLDYLHNNPLAGRWQLAADACSYNYSSAPFYEQNKNRFSFLKDLRGEF